MNSKFDFKFRPIFFRNFVVTVVTANSGDLREKRSAWDSKPCYLLLPPALLRLAAVAGSCSPGRAPAHAHACVPGLPRPGPAATTAFSARGLALCVRRAPAHALPRRLLLCCSMPLLLLPRVASPPMPSARTVPLHSAAGLLQVTFSYCSYC